MKASEIMINDLIYVYGQNGNILAEPHWYVRKVTADWLVAMDRSEANDKKLKDYGVVIPEQQPFIGDTKPIPLTEEILRENGFDIVQSGDSLIIWKQKDDEHGNEVYDITIYGAKGSVCFDTSIRYHGAIRKNIKFVHELQHALRLCGLNELADNLKIGGEE